MSNNHNDYNEFLSKWAKEHSDSEQDLQINKQTSARENRPTVQKPQSAKSAKTSKRTSSLRRQRQIYIIIGTLAALLVLLIFLIVLLCKGLSGDDKKLQELQGCWYYNEHTEYEFDGEGGGRMFFDEDKAFEYTYTVKDNTVCLDFELEYVTDCQYTYKVTGDKLTLIGGEGTAEIGKEYVLTRLHKHDK